MKNKISLLVFFTLLINHSFAQSYNATGLALGNNYMSYAKGIDAFKLNPAKLVYNRGVEFTFLSTDFGISNSALSSSDYFSYFTEAGHGGFWDGKEKKEVRNLLKDGIKIPLDFGINIFSMAYKKMGFGFDFVGAGNFDVKSGDVFDSALDLLDEVEFGLDYNIDQKEFINGEAYSAFKFSFAYSHLLRTRYSPWDLSAITAGAKINYLAGIFYAGTQNSAIKVQRFQEPKEGVFQMINLDYHSAIPGSKGIFPGSGFSMDLAGSVIYNDDWHISMKLENLFGFIGWEGNTEQTSIRLFDDGLDNNVEDVDTTITIKGKSFSTDLPMNLHIGAHYQLLEKLTLMAQYKQGLNEAFGNVFTPQIGVAAEYRPLVWLPLRSGMTIGGINDFLFGLGAGVDVAIFEFNLAFAMREAIWPNFSNGLYIAYDFKFKL